MVIAEPCACFSPTAQRKSDHPSHLKPLVATFTVYRLRLTLSSQDSNGAVPVGEVPAFTSKESCTLTDDNLFLGTFSVYSCYSVLLC